MRNQIYQIRYSLLDGPVLKQYFLIAVDVSCNELLTKLFANYDVHELPVPRGSNAVTIKISMALRMVVGLVRYPVPTLQEAYRVLTYFVFTYSSNILLTLPTQDVNLDRLLACK